MSVQMAMTVYNYPPSVFCSLRIRFLKKIIYHSSMSSAWTGFLEVVCFPFLFPFSPALALALRPREVAGKFCKI